jgi:hypothetical protein
MVYLIHACQEARPLTPLRWLLFMANFAPEQGTLRVRAWRRLQAMGALNIRTSCHVLPNSAATLEDFEWLRRELADEGVDVLLFEAALVEGLSDAALRDSFNAARDDEYRLLAERVRALRKELTSRRGRQDSSAQLPRLQREFHEIERRDHFGAAGREPAAALLGDMAPFTKSESIVLTAKENAVSPSLMNKTWITRQGVHVDRIASAWLVRRHIDANATFRFVAERHYTPGPGEVRFDMFDAEYTHVGDRCTFEVLLDHAGLVDPALRRIGEIVHDIDLKDSRYERAETEGVRQLLAGLVASTERDEDRLERGAALFDNLYQALSAKRPARTTTKSQ